MKPVTAIGRFAAAVTAAGQSSFLPDDAESTRVVNALQRDYKGGDDVPAIVVFEREGGLTKGDLNTIGRLGEGLDRLGIVGATPVFDPISSVLIVVGLILVLVLRALIAPAYLIATVVASFAATLGLVTFAFTELFGASGIAFNLTLLAFIFLVALGVDYNIFLMTRAREEARSLGTRDGTLAALVGTGGVVTGAGLILAGTFATLTLLPLEELVQIGATVAVGVLLDTFVVRALLVPSLTVLFVERAWWPGRARP